MACPIFFLQYVQNALGYEKLILKVKQPKDQKIRILYLKGNTAKYI